MSYVSRHSVRKVFKSFGEPVRKSCRDQRAENKGAKKGPPTGSPYTQDTNRARRPPKILPFRFSQNNRLVPVRQKILRKHADDLPHRCPGILSGVRTFSLPVVIFKITCHGSLLSRAHVDTSVVTVPGRKSHRFLLRLSFPDSSKDHNRSPVLVVMVIHILQLFVV